jgi:hypothetical protein
VFQEPLEVLETHCNAAALGLDASQPLRSSQLRIRHLLIYTPTLCNLGKAEESYEVLREAVKEAQNIDLFLEEKRVGLAEFDKVVRRKTFWNLYV